MEWHKGLPVAETEEESHAIYAQLDPEIRRAAVAFLRRALEPRLDEIRQLRREEPEGWWKEQHFLWGMAVRNLLRDNGYTEEQFGIGNLDDIWVELVEGTLESDESCRHPRGGSSCPGGRHNESSRRSSVFLWGLRD